MRSPASKQKARRKRFKPERPKRRVGIDVSVDDKLAIVLPFSIAKQRKQGAWKEIYHLRDGGVMTAIADAEINIHDIIAYCTLARAVQDGLISGRTQKGSLPYGSHIKDYYSLTMSKRDMCIEIYGSRDVREFDAWLVRMNSFSYTIQAPWGDCFTVRYFFDLQTINGQTTIVVSKEQIDYLLRNGWIFDLQQIKSISGNAGKALGIWLSKQKNTRYKVPTLCDAIHIQGEDKVRLYRLKEALKACEAAKAIFGWKIIRGIVFLFRSWKTSAESPEA